MLALTLVTLIVLGGLGYPLWWASIGGSSALALGAAIRRRLTVAELPFERAWLDGRAVPLPANIGPALTTYGSLATILWLTLCRRAGVPVTTSD